MTASPAATARERGLPVVHALAVLLLPALVVLLYRPGLDGPLVFDDYTSVYYNIVIVRVWPPWRFLTVARPLTELSLAVNVAQGGFQPWHFHATNVALHAVTVCLVYALAYRTLGLVPGRLAQVPARPAVALATAALFAVHPLQTEVVAYISGRSEGLAGMFYVLAVLLFSVAATSPRRRARRAAAAGLPVAAAAALASKEIAVTIPLALALYDWCFLAGRDGRRGPGLHWGLLGLSAAPLAVGAAVLLSGVVGRGDEVTAGFELERISPVQYLLTQFGVILHYARLVVLPIGQCADYDWPLARSPWTPGVLGPLAAVAAAAGGAVWAVRRCPLGAFGVLWMLVVLAPTSSILPIADLVAERRMYVALFGPLLALAAGGWAALAWAAGRLTPARWVPAAAYGAIAAVLAGASAQLAAERVRLWADPLALYEDVVRRAPGNPRGWLNLGALHVAAGRWDAALPPLREAERLYRRGESVHAFDRVGAYIQYNLGVVAYQQRRYQDAQAHLTAAREVGQRYLGLAPMIDLYLGHLALIAGDWSRAIAHFEESLRYGPVMNRGLILPYLARAHLRLGQREQALAYATQTLREDPANQAARRVLQELGVTQ